MRWLLLPERLTLVTLGLLVAAAPLACQKAKDKAAPGNTDPSQVVAVVGDRPITVAELQDRLDSQSPFVRNRYASAEKKKELLQEVVRFEVLASEAARRGYDQDPEVLRTMRQQMISKLMEKDFDAKHTPNDVPDAEVEKYYREHPEEFNKKDEVVVGVIVVKDKAKADKVMAEINALPKVVGVDQRGFHDLVTRYSEDEASKQQGGVMPSFDAESTAHPKAVVDASFALREVGESSAPVQTARGWEILKLLQKRPGFNRPLAEVRPQIQQRLFHDVRAKALETFIGDLEKKTAVVLHEENLSKVVIGAPGASASAVPASARLPPRP